MIPEDDSKADFSDSVSTPGQGYLDGLGFVLRVGGGCESRKFGCPQENATREISGAIAAAIRMVLF
jgi:hypothetical protein